MQDYRSFVFTLYLSLSQSGIHSSIKHLRTTILIQNINNMASATGIPQNPRVAPGELQDPYEAGYGEDEPLIGRAGDASQQEGRPLLWNLVLGI